MKKLLIEEQQQDTLNNVPNEIFAQIMRMLKLSERMKIAQTCKSLYAKANSASLWKLECLDRKMTISNSITDYKQHFLNQSNLLYADTNTDYYVVWKTRQSPKKANDSTSHTKEEIALYGTEICGIVDKVYLFSREIDANKMAEKISGIVDKVRLKENIWVKEKTEKVQIYKVQRYKRLESRDEINIRAERAVIKLFQLPIEKISLENQQDSKIAEVQKNKCVIS